jgi:hypothetical protein
MPLTRVSGQSFDAPVDHATCFSPKARPSRLATVRALVTDPTNREAVDGCSEGGSVSFLRHSPPRQREQWPA